MVGVALLAACVAAWVGSYWRCGQVQYSGRSFSDVFVGQGRIACCRDSYTTILPKGWHWYSYVPSGKSWPNVDARATLVFLGFSVHHSPTQLYVTFPMWMITAVAGGLALLVWRKPRGLKAGGGFPVEARGGAKDPGTKTPS
jgi:hypothetical protein